MSAISHSSSPLALSLPITPSMLPPSLSSGEEALKSSEEIPYFLKLPQSSLKLLEDFKNTYTSLPPQHPELCRLSRYPKGVLPVLRFTVAEMCTYVTAAFSALELIGEQDPFIIGGAAGHLMSGLEYSDIDLSYHLKKPDFETPKNCLCRFLLNQLKERHAVLLSLKEVEELYIYRKKIIHTADDWSSIIGLGDMLDLKFIFTKKRCNVSTSDGFMVSYATGMAQCVDGHKIVGSVAFGKSLDDLQQRRFVVHRPEEVQNLVFRLAHKCTQGFDAEAGLFSLAGELMQREAAALGIGGFAAGFFKHQANHYRDREIGAWLDMHNFLHIAMSSFTDPSKGRHFIQAFANAWLEIAAKSRPMGSVDELLGFILEHPEGILPLLACIKGFLLYKWLGRNPLLNAYAFSFAPHTLPLRMSISCKHSEGTHYAILGAPPEVVMRDFLSSLPFFDKLPKVSSKEGSVSPDVHFMAPVFRDLSPLCQKHILETFFNSFDALLLSGLPVDPLQGKGSALLFYEFAADGLPSSFQAMLGQERLPCLKHSFALLRLIEEQLRLREASLVSALKGMHHCLHVIYSFGSAKLRIERWQAYGVFLLKLPEKEVLAKSCTAQPHLQAGLSHGLLLGLHSAKLMRDLSCLPHIYICLEALSSAGMVTAEMRQNALYHFISACLHVEQSCLPLPEEFVLWKVKLYALVCKEKLAWLCHKQAFAQNAILDLFYRLSAGKPTVYQDMPLDCLHGLLQEPGSTIEGKEFLEHVLPYLMQLLKLKDTPPMAICRIFYALAKERIPLLNRLCPVGLQALTSDVLPVVLALVKTARKSDLLDVPRIAALAMHILGTHEPSSKRAWACLQEFIIGVIAGRLIQPLFVTAKILAEMASSAPLPSLFFEYTLQVADLLFIQAGQLSDTVHQAACEKESCSLMALLPPKEGEGSPHSERQKRLLAAVMLSFSGEDSSETTQKVFSSFVEAWSALHRVPDAEIQKSIESFSKLAKLDFKLHWSYVLGQFISFAARYDLAGSYAFLFKVESQLIPRHMDQVGLVVMKKLLDVDQEESLKMAYELYIAKRRLFECHTDGPISEQLLSKSLVLSKLLCAFLSNESRIKAYAHAWTEALESFKSVSRLRERLSSTLKPEQHVKLSSMLVRTIEMICFQLKVDASILAESFFLLASEKKWLTIVDQKRALNALWVSYAEMLELPGASMDLRVKCLRWLHASVTLDRGFVGDLDGDGVRRLWKGFQGLVARASLVELTQLRIIFRELWGDKDLAFVHLRQLVVLELHNVECLLAFKEDSAHRHAWDILYNLARPGHILADLWDSKMDSLCVECIVRHLRNRAGDGEFAASLENFLSALDNQEKPLTLSLKSVQALIPLFAKARKIGWIDYLWRAIERHKDGEPQLKERLQQQLSLLTMHEFQGDQAEAHLPTWFFLQRVFQAAETFDPVLYLAILQGAAQLSSSGLKEAYVLVFPGLLPEKVASRSGFKEDVTVQAYSKIFKFLLALARHASEAQAHAAHLALGESLQAKIAAIPQYPKPALREIALSLFYLRTKVASVDQYLTACAFFVEKMPKSRLNQNIMHLFRQFRELSFDQQGSLVTQALLRSITHWMEKSPPIDSKTDCHDFFRLLAYFCGKDADVHYWGIVEYILMLMYAQRPREVFVDFSWAFGRGSQAAEESLNLFLRYSTICLQMKGFRPADQILGLVKPYLSEKKYINCFGIALDCFFNWIISNLNDERMLSEAFHEMKTKILLSDMALHKAKVKKIICTLVNHSLDMSPKWCAAAHYLLAYAAKEKLYLVPDLAETDLSKAFKDHLCQSSAKLLYTIYQSGYRIDFDMYLEQFSVFQHLSGFDIPTPDAVTPRFLLFTELKTLSLFHLLTRNCTAGYKMLYNILRGNASSEIHPTTQRGQFLITRLILIELSVVPQFFAEFKKYALTNPKEIPSRKSEDLLSSMDAILSKICASFLASLGFPEKMRSLLVATACSIYALTGGGEFENACQSLSLKNKKICQLAMIFFIGAIKEPASISGEEMRELRGWVELSLQSLGDSAARLSYAGHLEGICAAVSRGDAKTLSRLINAASRDLDLKRAIVDLPLANFACGACPVDAQEDLCESSSSSSAAQSDLFQSPLSILSGVLLESESKVEAEGKVKAASAPEAFGTQIGSTFIPPRQRLKCPKLKYVYYWNS